MILIEDVLVNPAPLQNRETDYFEIEWFETFKTTFRRQTKNGTELAIRKKNGRPLNHGDVLWEDGNTSILVYIKPCDCIVLQPRTLKEMGIICFEIGNMHIPIAISEENSISVAFEAPLFSLFERNGYQFDIVHKQLLHTHFFKMH